MKLLLKIKNGTPPMRKVSVIIIYQVSKFRVLHLIGRVMKWSPGNSFER